LNNIRPDNTIYGSALNAFGFVGYETLDATPTTAIDEIGLLTRGFLWGLQGIWWDSDEVITTTWITASRE